MKIYIRASINSELMQISINSVNGGTRSKLKHELASILAKVPPSRYILVIGTRGYSTGYLKLDANKYKWLYNEQIKDIDSYWETSDTYVVLPESFEPSSRINYDDDIVKVYELGEDNKEIYSGLEDYEPMKDEDWKFCKDLGTYYLADYAAHKIYIKRKVAD